MKALNLTQGSDAWHEHRARARNASEASAVLACSPYISRDELMHALHTGIRPEPDVHQQRRFDEGHAIEAMLRPVAEEIIGEQLYPVVGVETVGGIELSASFDGLTMLETVNWECKTLNDELRAAFDDIETIAPEHRETTGGKRLPKCHRVQMEQQLAVCKGEKVLFTAGTLDGQDVRHCWYFPDPELRAEIISAWKQFDIDLAAYVPPEPAAPRPIGKTMETLPALRIEVTGMVTASNLDVWKDHALYVIAAVNRHLVTDQDFENAKKAVKWCADGKKNLLAAKQHALSQTESIDALFRMVDEVVATMDNTRLALEKDIKSRNDIRKFEIKKSGEDALAAHIQTCNARFTRPYMPALDSKFTDFDSAIRGKSSFANMQSAVNDLLAKAKIRANEIADGIDFNVKYLNEQAGETYRSLFPDVKDIVTKAADDFKILVDSRIATEKARLETERQRIEQAARDKLLAEQKAEADRLAKIESDRVAAEARQAAEAAKPAPTPTPAPIVQPAPIQTAAAPVSAPVANVVPIASPRAAAPAPTTINSDEWHPAETMPKSPSQWIQVQEVALYRWLPYKENSTEFKRGKKGRWQRHTGYGFDNAEPPHGPWRIGEEATAAA